MKVDVVSIVRQDDSVLCGCFRENCRICEALIIKTGILNRNHVMSESTQNAHDRKPEVFV